MKSLVNNLSDYKSVHLNTKNIVTHFIGVPLILWSLALLLSGIQFTVEVKGYLQVHSVLPIVALVIFTYYLLLNIKLALIAIICITPIYYHASLYSEHQYFFLLAGGVFLIGWLFQFLGHHYEKAKPAFIDDIRQLFIGPLFLIAELYFFVGFDKALAKEVEQLAIQKRQQLNDQ